MMRNIMNLIHKRLMFFLFLTGIGYATEHKYLLYYYIDGCHSECYLNDMLIEDYKTFDSEQDSFNKYIMLKPFLKNKANKLKIKIKPFYHSNNCFGKIIYSLDKKNNKHEKQTFFRMYADYNILKNDTRQKQMLMIKSPNIIQTAISDFSSEIVYNFDADDVRTELLPWESAEKISLKKEDNNEIKGIILNYSKAFLTKDIEKITELINYKEFYIKEVLFLNTNDLITKIVNISPNKLAIKDISIIRLSNNLFRSVIKNKNYLFKFPIKISKKELQVNVDINLDYAENSEGFELYEDHFSFDLFFSKIDGRWQIVY